MSSWKIIIWKNFNWRLCFFLTPSTKLQEGDIVMCVCQSFCPHMIITPDVSDITAQALPFSPPPHLPLTSDIWWPTLEDIFFPTCSLDLTLQASISVLAYGDHQNIYD